MGEQREEVNRRKEGGEEGRQRKGGRKGAGQGAGVGGDGRKQHS